MGSFYSRPITPPASRPFAGKVDRIAEQRAAFWAQQPAASEDTRAYFLGQRGHAYATDQPKWIKETTPFTNWSRPSLAESAGAHIIPNKSSFDVGQYPGAPATAGMSMIHLLGIPKAGLFNGVSLDADTAAIVDEIAATFRTEWATPEFRAKVLDSQREAIETRYQEARTGDAEAAEKGYEEALAHWTELRGLVDGLAYDDFTFGLHLWPDQSIAHLHVHIVAVTEACRRYSTRAHDDKTKDAFEVRDHVLAVPMGSP
ncbi:hypothetical protein AAE478_007400 [Parahypoxylon ruwenzoriense]